MNFTKDVLLDINRQRVADMGRKHDTDTLTEIRRCT